MKYLTANIVLTSVLAQQPTELSQSEMLKLFKPPQIDTIQVNEWVYDNDCSIINTQSKSSNS